MAEQLGIVTAEHCYLRSGSGSGGAQNENGIEDEIFSGWAVRVLPAESGESAADGWLAVETHYGYRGYVRAKELKAASRGELLARQDKNRYFRLGIGEADLLDRPKVQGLPLELILKDALVELLDTGDEGWSRVRTAAGREGYVHTEYLRERKDDDGYLLAMDGVSKTKPYFIEYFEKNRPEEKAFRDGAVKSAMAYLGTQYRWGGKSAQGIDCSGLVFMSYLENGVLIYRDAKIMPEYPVVEIPKEALREGDLIFFPGHVAMYIGNGKYIHSTAYSKTPYVTVNSLNPEDEDYREDLVRIMKGCGSVFPQKVDAASESGERTAVPETAAEPWKAADEPGTAAESRKAAVEPETAITGRKTTIDSKTAEEKQECPTMTESAVKDFEEKLTALPGSISMLYKNLSTGEQYAYRAAEPHIAASVIKLFLMAAAFQCFGEGRLRPEDEVCVAKKDCVPSCGVLTYLPENHRISVRGLVELMIIVSDNTATNVLFDLVGEEYLNTFIKERLGLEQTGFNRKMFDSERAARGIENYVTASEVAALLEGIWRGEVVSPEASREMYQILTHQRLNGKIPFYLHTLPDAPVIAHKTGEDDGITHDVGIIEGKEPFLLCFLGSETDVPEYERRMAEIARDIFLMISPE